MTTRDDDIKIIEGVRTLSKGLRRTGIMIAVLSVIAGGSAIIDYPYAGFVVGATLGTLTGRGIVMATGAGRVLRSIDAEIRRVAFAPRRGVR